MSIMKPLSRRQFLATSALAGAAPYLIPGAALGAESRPSPSNRITVGLIGIGNQGSGHLDRLLGDPGFQLIACCDVWRQVRDKTKAKAEQHYAQDTRSGIFKGFTSYPDFREMMQRTDMDAVLIAVPEHWHALIVIEAAKAGKDIYCEKPLSHTIHEAEKMVAAVRRYDRVFQTGSQQRSSNEFYRACELVRNGRIGKLQTVHVGVGGTAWEKYFPEEPIPDGFDYDMWLGPAPLQPFNSERVSGSYSGGWRQVRDYSGGMMCDWGAHHFDIAQWGMGEDGNGPIAIYPPDGKEYPELTYKYASGVTMYHGGANGILFTGTEGKVEVNRGYFKTWPDSIGKEVIGPNDIQLYHSTDHHANWLECMKTRKKPICDVAIGASSIKVCHLGNIAYWLKRPLKWDPVNDHFIGDPEADRWLDRPMREPWRLT